MLIHFQFDIEYKDLHYWDNKYFYLNYNIFVERYIKSLDLEEIL